MLGWSQSTASQLYSSTWRTKRPFQNYPALGNGCVSQPVRKPLSWKEGKKENHYGKWNKRQRSDQKPLSISSSTTHSSEKTALRRYFTVTIHCTLSMIMHRLCHTDWGMCWMQTPTRPDRQWNAWGIVHVHHTHDQKETCHKKPALDKR